MTNLESLIKQYQSKLIENGHKPNTSEFVRRCLTMYGLPGAFQAYIRINERRADRQLHMMHKEQEHSRSGKKLLTAIFAVAVTPVETIATMIGKGEQIQQFNSSLGAADWDPETDSSPQPASPTGSSPKPEYHVDPKDYPPTQEEIDMPDPVAHGLVEALGPEAAEKFRDENGVYHINN